MQLLSCLQGNIIDSHQYDIGALVYQSWPRNLLRINCNIKIAEGARKVLLVKIKHPAHAAVFNFVAVRNVAYWHFAAFAALQHVGSNWG